MKPLKFKSNLVDQILAGTKTVTWRLFDDKDLKVGDTFAVINSDDGKEYGQAEIVEIKEKKLGEMTEVDYEYSNYEKETQIEMLHKYQAIYGDKVTLDTVVKMVKFKLNK